MISWESESTRSPCTPCLHPTPCPTGAASAGKVPILYLFCGKSAQHSGVANTKLQGKDTERRSWAA